MPRRTTTPDTTDPQQPTSARAATLPAFTPVPRKKQRHNGWTPERQRLFIEALADTGSVKSAARSVGLTPESAYYLRRQPGAEQFRKAWEAALDIGVQRIEDVAMDRALNGVDQPVFAYGEFVGTRRVYNDQLLMFMLRARAPERFATGGGARALNGSDKFQLKLLKKQWRAEWEAERAALSQQETEDTMEALATRFDKAEEHWLSTLSPRTRAAWDAFKTLEAEDKANGYEWWTDPDHPLNLDAGSQASQAEDDWQVPMPSPEMLKRLPDHSPRAVDDGWEIIEPEEPADDED